MFKIIYFKFRFHLHVSFIFEIIFVACWLCAYFYMVNLHQLYDTAGTYSSQYDTNVQANITFYGYGFVVLNIIQGAFVLCFHCFQSERVSKSKFTIFFLFCFTSLKFRPLTQYENTVIHFIQIQIRREYQKFVKDSWLPQCLLCNIDVNDDQGPTASPTNNALSANVLLPASNASTKKKSDPESADMAGTFLSGSPVHQPYNQASTLMRHHHSSQRK